MEKYILKRDHPDGKNFEIDVTDYSFIEFVDIIKDKAELGGMMTVIHDDIRFIVDNKKFFGRIE